MTALIMRSDSPHHSTASHSDRVYKAVRELLVNFQLRPDERINESALARQLDTSRTPLREALNRLAAEGFLSLSEGKGFHCASFHPESVLDLYELRQALETEAARLASVRASDAALADLAQSVENCAAFYHSGADANLLLQYDELFHVQLVALAANAELSRQLALVNDRIRFFRLVDLEGREGLSVAAHRAVVVALQSRDSVAAADVLRSHIVRSREEANAAVARVWSRVMMCKASQA